MSIELKIKSKTLMAEARIIRAEEHKLKRQAHLLLSGFYKNPKEDLEKWATEARDKRFSISAHRRCIVASEARRTFLARGFLRGLPYHRMEAKVHDNNKVSGGCWKAIEDMVKRFGAGDMRDRMQRFEEWKQAACAEA